jgi:hypothetical protein
MPIAVSRRGALAALLAAFATPALTNASLAAGRYRFRAIEVDVAPLRRAGHSQLADWLAADLPGDLRRSFASHMAPGDRNAFILRVRIDSASQGRVRRERQRARDQIAGVGLVIGAGGRRIASYPLSTSVTANVAQRGPATLSRSRVASLGNAFASRLPGAMRL